MAAGFRLGARTLRELSQRRDAPGLRRALAHLGAVGAGVLALWHFRDTVWFWPLLWVAGYPMAFLFNAMHECAHQSAFRSRWLNLTLGHLAGLVILLPYEYYRSFHWDHHRHTQQPGLDPELTLILPRTRLGVAWLMLGFPVWFRRNLPTLLRHACGRVRAPWVVPERRPAIVLEARLYLACYLAALAASVITQSWALVLLWLAPLAAGHMLLRPYLLAEHTGCGHSQDMMENTRSLRTSRLVRFFAWNMPFHAEHHAYPAVPFHALPRLHALAAPHLRRTPQGYWRTSVEVCRWMLSADRAQAPASAVSASRTQ